MQFVWRYDMMRQVAASIVGFGMILNIALAFDGDDCVNFYTVYATDLVVGMILESGMLAGIKAGGYRLGFYGQPPKSILVERQITMTCVLSAMARCSSGILAVAVFPYTNKNFEAHVDTAAGWAYMAVVAPAMYMIIRLFALDSARAENRVYRPVRHVPLSTRAVASAFTIGNVSSDDDDVGKDTGGSAAAESADNVARDTEAPGTKPDESAHQQQDKV